MPASGWRRRRSSCMTCTRRSSRWDQRRLAGGQRCAPSQLNLDCSLRLCLCLPCCFSSATRGLLLLQEKGRIFREAFLSKLQLLLRGTVAAPPERFGETLADEHIRGGAFVGPDNKPVVVHEHLPNAHMRLFGGAQYHRAMAEFRAGGRVAAPAVPGL